MKRMRRAGPNMLARISPLLEDLRAHPELREKRPGCFYLRGNELLHFHETSQGVVAEVHFAHRSARLPVTTRSEQLDLLAYIEECLLVIESRAVDRRRRGAHRGHRAGTEADDSHAR